MEKKGNPGTAGLPIEGAEMNQTMKVLEMLRKGPITRYHGFNNGVLNLTARIADLRKLGYGIHCQMIQADGHGSSEFGRWHLVFDVDRKKSIDLTL